MREIVLKGPYTFKQLHDIEANVTGVYLWCVQREDGLYRVYYIGEAVNIRNRLSTHKDNQLSGKYSGHLISALKHNIKILVHSGGEGILKRFGGRLERKQFNQDFLDAMYLFCTEIPSDSHHDDKTSRCRVEAALAHHIGESGQNILHIGQLNYSQPKTDTFVVRTPNCQIEYLTDQEVRY